MKSFQELRKEKITQEKLSKILGIDTSTVSKWESGVSTPRLSLIPKIAESLEVDVETLINSFKKQGAKNGK